MTRSLLAKLWGVLLKQYTVDYCRSRDPKKLTLHVLHVEPVAEEFAFACYDNTLWMCSSLDNAQSLHEQDHELRVDLHRKFELIEYANKRCKVL